MTMFVTDPPHAAGQGGGRVGDDPGRRAGPRPFASGDDFDRFVRPILPQLVGVARRVLGSDDLAWDAVQGALLDFWSQAKAPANPRAWLVRAVVYRSLHLARSLARRRKHEERACWRRTEASERDDPALIVDLKDLGPLLHGAISRLSQEHRAVFVLREIEEMDYESIARTLHVPVGTVRSRLNRAREAIREIVAREFPEA